MCCASRPAAARQARQKDMLRRRSFFGLKRRCRSTKPQERATVLMNQRSSREKAFYTCDSPSSAAGGGPEGEGVAQPTEITANRKHLRRE